MRWLRSLATLAALATAVLIWAEDADARVGGGENLGSLGARTFILWPVAATAARHAVALEHATPSQVGHSYPGGSLGGLFNRPGLIGGFAAGFLGAGLLGLLFGQGLFGGLGGVASFLGLVFQLALIALLGRLIWTWWNGRNTPAFAGLSPRQLADAYERSRNDSLLGGALAAASVDATQEPDIEPDGAAAAEPSTRRERE